MKSIFTAAIVFSASILFTSCHKSDLEGDFSTTSSVKNQKNNFAVSTPETHGMNYGERHNYYITTHYSRLKQGGIEEEIDFGFTPADAVATTLVKEYTGYEVEYQITNSHLASGTVPEFAVAQKLIQDGIEILKQIDYLVPVNSALENGPNNLQRFKQGPATIYAPKMVDFLKNQNVISTNAEQELDHLINQYFLFAQTNNFSGFSSYMNSRYVNYSFVGQDKFYTDLFVDMLNSSYVLWYQGGNTTPVPPAELDKDTEVMIADMVGGIVGGFVGAGKCAWFTGPLLATACSYMTKNDVGRWNFQ